MKRKIICFFLAIMLISCSVFTFSACNTNKNLNIVFLGDSIAEAVLGPSPICERERYGYYAVIGEINDYKYYNRSVSGHQTKQMLEYISREDNGASMTKTHIMEADVIHTSIIGNDVLQVNMGEIVLAAINDDYEILNKNIASARANFALIVAKLKELNPNAILIFQSVYNPMFEGSKLLAPYVMEQLNAQNVSAEEIRSTGAVILKKLNSVFTDYLNEHPGAFEYLDVNAEFDQIYTSDPIRGKNLIYGDGVHPSNEGHAVIACMLQDKLVELKKANAREALEEYKDLRCDQLDDLYEDTSVDVKATEKAINKAKSMREVTEIYFKAIRGVEPDYLED